MHNAIGLKYDLVNPVSKKYDGGFDIAVTNFLLGSTNYSDGYWCGFEGNDLEEIIEFKII